MVKTSAPEQVLPKVSGEQRIGTKATEKSKYSNFWITVTLNKTYPKDVNHNDPQLRKDAAVLDESIKSVFGTHLKDHVNILEEGKTWDGSIQKADVKYAVELAPKLRKLHFHAHLRIRHTTRVQLNYESCKAKLKELNNINSIYWYTRLVKASGEDFFQAYLEKSASV